MPELLMERPKMSLQMHETLKRYILRERRKKKEEDVAIEQKMQEELKKVEINTQTLEKTKEQLRLMEIKLEDLQLKKRDLFNQLKKVLNEETNLKKQQSSQQQHQQQNIPPHLLTNFNPTLIPSSSPALNANGTGNMLFGPNGGGLTPHPPSPHASNSLPGQNNSKSPFHIPHPHVSNLPFMSTPAINNLNKYIAAVAAGGPSMSPQLLIPPLPHQPQVLGGSHHNMLNYSPSSSPHLSNSSPSRHSQQQTSQSPSIHKRQRSPSPPQTPISPHLNPAFIYNQSGIIPSRSPAHGPSSPPLTKQQQQQQFNSPVSSSNKKIRNTSSNQSPHHNQQQQMSNRGQNEYSQMAVTQNPQSGSSAFSQFNRTNGGGGITSGQVVGFQSPSNASHSKSANNRNENGFSTPPSHHTQSPNFSQNRQQQQQHPSHSPGIPHNFPQLNQHYLNQFTPSGAAVQQLLIQQQQQQSLAYQQQTIQMMASLAAGAVNPSMHQHAGPNSNVVSSNTGGGGGGSILTGFSVRPPNSSSSGMSQPY